MGNLIHAFVRRRKVLAGPVLTPPTRNVRPFLDVPYDELPDPIRYGEFVNEGKPWGKARMQIAVVGYSPAQIHSVQEDEFGRHPVLIAEAPNAAVPRGAQLPFKERTNIARRQATAYGSLVTMTPKTYDYSLFASRNGGTYDTGQVH